MNQFRLEVLNELVSRGLINGREAFPQDYVSTERPSNLRTRVILVSTTTALTDIEEDRNAAIKHVSDEFEKHGRRNGWVWTFSYFGVVKGKYVDAVDDDDFYYNIAGHFCLRKDIV